MAGFNEIQVGRFNGVLHKLLDMKEGAPAPSLSSDVIPTLCLENDRPEYKFLGGERLAAGVSDLVATAGQQAYARLRNPANSGVLCILEQAIITVAASTDIVEIRIQTESQAFSATGLKAARDRRMAAALGGGGDAVTCIVETLSSAVTVGALVGRVRLDAAAGFQPLVYNVPWVLGPSDSITFRSQTAANRLIVSWSWRERVLERSETR